MLALTAVALGGSAAASQPSAQNHLARTSIPASHFNLGLCGLSSRADPLTVICAHNVNPISFSFPAKVTSRDKARIEALARSLCTLPPANQRDQCLADWGTTYTLDFGYLPKNALGGRPITPVVVDPTGCEFVTGLVGPRWAYARRRFWSDFGAAIGLHHATPMTFAGKVANG